MLLETSHAGHMLVQHHHEQQCAEAGLLTLLRESYNML